MLGIIAGIAGAGLSLWGEYSRKLNEEDAIEARRKALEEAKITEGEKNVLESDINKYYNISGINSANASAFGVNSLLNENTIRALQSSQLLGRRANALSQLDQKVLDYNKNIELSEGNLPSASGINIGNVLLGGIEGYQIGDNLINTKWGKQADADILKWFNSK